MGRITHTEARRRLLDVIDSIERSVAENNATTPLTDSGKLTIQAVLRMAGLGATYFTKKRTAVLSLKQEVISRLAKIEVLAHNSRAVPAPLASRKGHYERAETIAVMQRYAEAELEYAATLADLERARQKIAELENDVSTLQRQVGMVIPFNRSSSTST